jgi:hypothetical protein
MLLYNAGNSSATPELVSEQFGDISTLQRMNKISIERAEQIALAVIRVMWSNRGLNLSKVDLDSRLTRFEKQTGVNKRQLVRFYAEELLAGTFEHCTGATIRVQYVRSAGEENSGYDAKKIALALLKARGLELRPDFQTRLERVEKKTGIPVTDLGAFFAQEVTPVVVAEAFGWKSCKIIAE